MGGEDDGGAEVPEHPSSAEQIGDIGEQIGEGLGQAEENIPEEEEDAKAVVETTRDVVDAVTNLANAAEGGRDLAEAIEAGDEARVASSVGNLTGGIAGTAGGALDAIAGTMPEGEGREAFGAAATVARGIGGAARATEQVVDTIQTIERAVAGRRLRFNTGADLGGDRLVAERAEGRQTLSGLYEFKILVEHDVEGGLDDEAIDGLLTASARLGLTPEAMGPGDVYGVVRRVEMLPMTNPRPTHYELTLVPKLWRLTQTKRSRVHSNRTHVEVVMDLLQLHGIEVADHTEETYPTHEYVVQYQESDFDFMSRLLARNGVHYHFVQDPGVEALVLGDRNAAFEPVELADELVYHPHDFAPDDNEARVWDLRRIREPLVRTVAVRDYNWRAPHHRLRSEEVVDDATGYGYADLFGEHFRDDAQGARFARIRAEELRVRGETYEGKTSLRGVRPGSVFELTNHPNPNLNQRYLVIETDEHMDDGYTYTNTFRAIPYSVTYRPPQTVPWPKVEGVINAIVDGERQSTGASIDDQGRYRVVLPIDEAGTAGGTASRWVRRAQPSAGAGYGMHLPLHIGTEVAIAHVNGDPDRPIIVGAVPNAATPSPVVAANGPQSRIRTGSGVIFELDDDC